VVRSTGNVEPQHQILLPDRAMEQTAASRLPYVTMVAIVSALVISLAVAAIWIEKRQNYQRARVATQNIAVLLEQHLTDVFDKVDVVLQAVAVHHHEHIPSRAGITDLNGYLEKQQALLPEILSLRIIDRGGMVRFGGGVDAANPVSLADRDFFIRARDEPAAGLIVAGPVLARISQQWVIVLARRLNHADGSFAGVVYANIATLHFEKAMSGLSLGAHGAATIRTTDLALVHRYPDTKGAVGSKEVSQQLRDHFKAQPNGGEYTAVTKIDGIERANVYRRLDRYPFYVLVGLATEDFMGEGQFHGLLIVSLAGLTLLVVVFSARRLYRSAQRHATDERNRRRVREQDAILNSNVLGIMVIKDRRFAWCNERIAHMLGYEREDLIGQPTRIVYPDDEEYAAFARDIAPKIDAGQLCNHERLYRRKDGSLGWFELCGQQMTPQGTESIWSVVDITERKATQQALQLHQDRLEDLVKARTHDLESAESRLRLLIDSAADGIIELDARGNVRMTNPAACNMLGYLPEDLLGRNVHEAIHYRHADGSPYPVSECAVVNAVIAGRKLRLDSDIFWHASGQPVPVAVATHPIWQDNRVVGAVLSFFDNTERDKAEQAREEARQAAEQLAKIKSEFLANMSHEIRTPLNGVLGMAQIGYRDSIGRGKAQETFARILDSGRLLLTIINDILDFSKIEAGKLGIESTPFDPAYVVDDAISALEGAAVSKGLRMIGVNAADLPAACLGDAVRSSQILLNLLSNAVKFTAAGEVRLDARREDTQLVFQVTDSGIGIAPEHIERLFMPFEQADGSTTRQFGGTGLGLAISRRLAEMMGGSLTATSEVGHGSTFTLRLPLRETDQPVQRGNRATLGNGTRLAGLRILAAEDNAVNQLVLEDFLTREGAEIKVVGNGRLAVEAVEQGEAFDAVLMDVQMPVMDGLEATRKLRQIAPTLPIIGQTAHALKEEHDRCLAAGMVATVTKPLDADLLVATVLDHVGTPDKRPAVPALAIEVQSPPETQVIDWAALAQRYPDRPEFIDRLVALTLESHAKDADHLLELIQAGDLQEIGKLAHAIKGLAGNLHAPELGKISLRVMHSAKADSDDALLRARELADGMERLMAELRQGRPD
jgi:PAS domain S-box-containing protein